MTVPCEGQLLLLTPPFDDLIPEPIVLGTMQFCPGLMDEHGKQVSSAACWQVVTAPKLCLQGRRSAQQVYLSAHLSSDQHHRSSRLHDST